ncbi:MAG: hypothetical protein JRG71_15890 [Deltaproteobacteria bacterium]|nr:hypothetical protein [Deltaproteobacteria bacterium]
MIIRIQRVDGLYDMVKPQALDRMLKEGSLKRFMRSVGWVTVATDAIRTHDCDNDHYVGTERRVPRPS